MRLEFSPLAQWDLRHVARIDSAEASDREAVRIHDRLEHFATLPAEGVAVLIDGWPRAVHRWSVHPFRVYYERRGRTLCVVRLYHHAREPIER